jgi:tetratricopeptide (TPR) repeat protein
MQLGGTVMWILRGAVLAGIAIGSILQGSSLPESYYQQGVQAYKLGDYSTAANMLASAERQLPGKTDALLVLSRALMALNRFADAEAAARSYCTEHKDAEGWYQLGRIEFVENKPLESLAAMTRGAQQRTPKGEDLRIVGLDYVLLNDNSDAAHWLEIAAELAGNNADLWYELGRTRYALAQYEQAGEAFNQALAIDPHHVRAAANLGLVYEAVNRIEPAIQLYRQAIAWQDNAVHKSEQPFLFLGTLLSDEGNTEEATKLLTEATQIAPQNPEAHGELGHAYISQGQFELGKQELEKATELSPNEAKWHFQLGQVYRKLGMNARAQAEFSVSADLLNPTANNSGTSNRELNLHSQP